jgi:2-oxoglutarate ferredoxin oxidoreductase subunit alpha
MSTKPLDLTIAIGGAAGQGIATPGNILAKIFARRGLHLYSYNAHQSIIRGGHILLMLRVGDGEVLSHGDRLDILVCLNQDTMDRHLGLLGEGGRVLFNNDDIEPGEANPGVHLCPMPVKQLTGDSKNKVIQNTLALGVITSLLGADFVLLGDALKQSLGKKGPEVIEENISIARAGFDYAKANFETFPEPLPKGPKPLAVWAGNDALAIGAAAAGVKFYAAYPMSPASGVLHWMAQNGRGLGIMVRQVEDEIGVACMTIGAAHSGARAMCATSGGGFALMTEAVGAASMMEIPAVFINVMRAGPSTGVPTKTEQGDLRPSARASSSPTY